MKTRPQALARTGYLILGLILTGSSCAVSRSTLDEPATTRPIRLTVTNNYNGVMTIYAVASRTVFRMGTVLPGFVGQFVVRRAMVGNGMVEFIAQATRQTPVRSDPLLLFPGDEVDFEIAANLVHSTATVRSNRH